MATGNGSGHKIILSSEISLYEKVSTLMKPYFEFSTLSLAIKPKILSGLRRSV